MGNLSPEQLSSRIGLYDDFADPMIDDLEIDQEFIDMIYDKLAEQLDSVDYGGGIFGITTRKVLANYKKPEKLRIALGLRKTHQNNLACDLFLKACKDSMSNDPYGY